MSRISTVLYLPLYKTLFYVAHMGEKRNAYMVLVGKLEGTRVHGRPMHKWKDNIKMDLKDVGPEGKNCVYQHISL